MTDASATVAPVRFLWVVARVSCKLCPRRGQYRIVRLAARYGPDVELERLLKILAADCRYMRAGINPQNYVARCGVRFTDVDGGDASPDVPPGLEVPILRIVKRWRAAVSQCTT